LRQKKKQHGKVEAHAAFVFGAENVFSRQNNTGAFKWQ